MIRRILLVAAMLIGAFAVAQPAHAGSYQFDCGFVLDPPVVEPGGTVRVIGSGFEPGTEVDFFINDQYLGTASVDPNDTDGNIDATFQLPPEFAGDGQYVITAECPSGAVASNVLIVGTGVATPPQPPLTPTGSDSTDLVRLGVGLLLVGGLVFVLARRRSEHATPVSS